MMWVRCLNPRPADGAVAPFRAWPVSRFMPLGEWYVIDATGANVLELETATGRKLGTTHKRHAKDLAERWNHGRQS